MPIDPEVALAATPRVRELSWSTRDVLLYHLSLGAGRDEGAGNDAHLRLTYERELAVLPTFAVVAGQGPSADGRPRPTGDRGASGLMMEGIDIALDRVLHAAQSVTAHRPLPPTGTATLTSRVLRLEDKERAAVIVLEHSAQSSEREPLWTAEMQIWARGEGGFGGDAALPGHAPVERPALPDREPDLVIDARTWPDQALLYRLNGDLNPLHVDPEFAARMGFPAPILHGLASYGVVARALVDGAADGDTRRLQSFSARFAGPVQPGQTLRTRAWDVGGDLVFETVCPEQDNARVLSRGHADIS